MTIHGEFSTRKQSEKSQIRTESEKVDNENFSENTYFIKVTPKSEENEEENDNEDSAFNLSLAQVNQRATFLA